MMEELARRAFLKGVFATFMTGGGLSLAGCSNESPPRGAPAALETGVAPVYVSYLSPGPVDNAAIIADRYLAVFYSNSTSDELHALVQPTATLAASNSDINASVQALRDKVKTDFAAGTIVDLDGWYFAETEMHICVLASRPEVA